MTPTPTSLASQTNRPVHSQLVSRPPIAPFTSISSSVQAYPAAPLQSDGSSSCRGVRVDVRSAPPSGCPGDCAHPRIKGKSSLFQHAQFTYCLASADLLLASPFVCGQGIEDTTPQVLHQLLEFAHRTSTRSSHQSLPCHTQHWHKLTIVSSALVRFFSGYTTDILLDSLTYSEHAGKGGKLDVEDVSLAVQAKVNWSFKEGGERDVRTPSHIALEGLVRPWMSRSATNRAGTQTRELTSVPPCLTVLDVDGPIRKLPSPTTRTGNTVPPSTERTRSPHCTQFQPHPKQGPSPLPDARAWPLAS